ncbi:MAG: hypothetical protein GX800_12070 [Clostridiaceae bacterium]|nr:hypothetical protein [Clostridiaceae bacterium]
MKKLFVFIFWLLLSLNATAQSDIVRSLTEKLPYLADYSFSGSSQTGENYTASFYRDNNTGESIKITVKSDGTILNYLVERPLGIGTKKIIPNISKNMAYQTALNFINTVASDITDEVNKSIYSNTYSFVSEGFNIHFNRIVNGINYPNDGITILIDGNTGRLVRYNRKWNEKIVFSPTDKIIPLADAEKFFEENIRLELRHMKKAVSSVGFSTLVYTPAFTGYIDAANGEATMSASPVFTGGYNEMRAMLERTTVVDSDNAYLNNDFSASDAIRHIMRTDKLRIDENFVLNDVEYYKKSNADVLITLNFNRASYTASVILNAATFDIIGFENNYNAVNTSAATIDASGAMRITDKFIAEQKSNYIAELAPPQMVKSQNTTDNAYTVLYERTVNSIPFKNNYISFVVNLNGDIISMSSVWDDIMFDNSDSAIPLGKAYDIFFETVGLQLTYVQTNENYATAVYIINPQVAAIIDARTGDLLAYDGNKARPQKALNYIGLDGHYAIVPVTVLAEYDVFVSYGDVVLDGNITQQDFILMLASVAPNDSLAFDNSNVLMSDELDMIYAAFVSSDIIERENVNPTGLITRAEAVKYLIGTIGYKEVAELEGIFKMHFLDMHKIPPNLYGYVSLARGFGLVSGSGGYFYPNQYLTNADALILIYNYLNLK